MDINVNDVLEFSAGKIKVQIIVTHVDAHKNGDVSGNILNDVPGFPKGKFLYFTGVTFNAMVSDGVLTKVARPKGIKYA